MHAASLANPQPATSAMLGLVAKVCHEKREQGEKEQKKTSYLHQEEILIWAN